MKKQIGWIAVALTVLLAFPLQARADRFQVDDTQDSGSQHVIDLPAVLPGSAIAVETTIRLISTGQKHLDDGTFVQFISRKTDLPDGYQISGGTLTVGESDRATANITFTAPQIPQEYTYHVWWTTVPDFDEYFNGSNQTVIRLTVLNPAPPTDTTPPQITAQIIAPDHATDGWYNQPVTVHFTCTDDQSGIAVCPDDVTLASEGFNQSVTGTAIDKAGNQQSATLSDINIDLTPPTVTISGPVSGGPPYILGAAPTPGYSAYDRLSTVRDAAATLTGGTPTGVGRYTYTATATDKAGNTTANWVTYEVDYRFDGFLQPIIVPITAFKAGSTVPVKFQLKTAGGTPVQAGTAPIVSIVPISGSGTPVSGAARWDSLSQQYIYNWQTPKTGAGTIWRITLKLDDPSAHTVDIPLK